MLKTEQNFTAVRNPCKLCTPLGAVIVFRGIEGGMPFLHGSQGCATYIRRYIISHFREPMDIASSGFSEDTAVFGGKQNLKIGLQNLYKQYKPKLIGIATTCLAETIGENIELILKEINNESFLPKDLKIVTVSTPSYKGTHIDGFNSARNKVVESLAEKNEEKKQINIFPNFLSCADLRHLKEILEDFKINYILFPDYSETLDGGIWNEYHKIPNGGTKLEQLSDLGNSIASIEFTQTQEDKNAAGKFLFDKFKIPFFKIGMPQGIKETDIFFNILEKITNSKIPQKYFDERARLIDSYVDAHKYVFEKKAIVYGEEDSVVAMVSFLSEIGIIPVLCSTGAKSGFLKDAIYKVAPKIAEQILITDDSDFMKTSELAAKLNPDIIIGNSKGYSISRKLNIPLIRIGFPIHDSFGGQRILSVGYRGTQNLFDKIVNVLLSKKQDDSKIGYSYL